MAQCIDLKQAQDKYRVYTSDSYSAETGSTTNRNTDPWNWELRGRRGHVSPWGDELLMLCLNDGHCKLSKRLSQEPWVDLSRSQYGDDGINAVFHFTDLDLAAEIAKLYVRRVPSERERLRQVEAGRKLSSMKKSALAGPSDEQCNKQGLLF